MKNEYGGIHGGERGLIVIEESVQRDTTITERYTKETTARNLLLEESP